MKRLVPLEMMSPPRLSHGEAPSPAAVLPDHRVFVLLGISTPTICPSLAGDDELDAECEQIG